MFGLAAAIIAESFDGAARVGMLAVLQILSTIGNVGAVLVKMAVNHAASLDVIARNRAGILFALGGLPILLAGIGIVFLREPESCATTREHVPSTCSAPIVRCSPTCSD